MEKPYKIYHRNYNSIEELYDDLKSIIKNIILVNDNIIINAQNSELKIRFKHYGYITYINGNKEKQSTEDQDIYYVALEFVHDEAFIEEIGVIDNSIKHINIGNNGGIWYLDNYNRSHYIDFNTCAINFKSEHANASNNCIGERCIITNKYIFFTSGVKTVIYIKKRLLSCFFRNFLNGSVKKRFYLLNDYIKESGYKTYDLS